MRWPYVVIYRLHSSHEIGQLTTTVFRHLTNAQIEPLTTGIRLSNRLFPIRSHIENRDQEISPEKFPCFEEVFLACQDVKKFVKCWIKNEFESRCKIMKIPCNRVHENEWLVRELMIVLSASFLRKGARLCRTLTSWVDESCTVTSLRFLKYYNPFFFIWANFFSFFPSLNGELLQVVCMAWCSMRLICLNRNQTVK